MLLGLLFLGLVPAAFLADGFLDDAKEVEPDETQPIADVENAAENANGDFIANIGTPDPEPPTQQPESQSDTAKPSGAVGPSDDQTISDSATPADASTDENAVEGDILDPIDQPGEGAPGERDATLLDKLLAENTDAIYGLPEYERFSKDPDPLQLGDGDNTHVGSSDGVKADGALKLFNGTPFVDLENGGLVGVIDGQGGDDTITTGDDASFVFGGEGNDQIMVGAAPAAVFGGAGDDEIIGAYTADQDEYSGYLDGGLGNDSITGGEGVDLIFGGQHNEIGEGSDNDSLSGGAGNDQISGGYGADQIRGGSGNDVLNHLGHAMERSGAERSSFDWHIDNDADTLDGGDGDDTLIFDRADIATGGAGSDNFHLYFDHDTGEGHANVTDFVSGEDFLRVTLEPDVDPDDVTLDVSASEDGEDAVVRVNGEIVAVLQGAPNATAADVRVEVMQEVYA